VAISPSIVLITVDCLRADHVGFNGYSRPTTPFLDSLATEGTVFCNAMVTGTPTYYSFPGIMASRHPLALGRDVVGLAPEEPTLATALKRAGYATGAFLAANPYLSPRFGYNAGFDTFRDFLDTELLPIAGTTPRGEPSLPSRLNRGLDKISHQFRPLGAFYDEMYFRYGQRRAPAVKSMDALQRFPAADKVVDEASAFLASVGERPFFLWLHLMDPHAPYYPPEQALALMGGDVKPERARYLNSYWNRALLADRFAKYLEPITALYDAGIRWVDAQVQRLVQTLRQSERWQNCVFALTADHGEQFLEHGDRYHAPTKLTEELIRVPLLVRGPGPENPQMVRTPFSLLHLAPTLLAAAGVSVPEDFRGKKSSNDSAVVECVAGCNNPYRTSDRMGARILAVRESRYKLTLDFLAKNALLFDLERDPGELRPLPESEAKPERRRLLERAHQHFENFQMTLDNKRRLDVRLRDLRLEWST
jgi:arylsulfatase A-like enzyme